MKTYFTLWRVWQIYRQTWSDWGRRWWWWRGCFELVAIRIPGAVPLVGNHHVPIHERFVAELTVKLVLFSVALCMFLISRNKKDLILNFLSLMAIKWCSPKRRLDWQTLGRRICSCRCCRRCEHSCEFWLVAFCWMSCHKTGTSTWTFVSLGLEKSIKVCYCQTWFLNNWHLFDLLIKVMCPSFNSSWVGRLGYFTCS